MIFLAASIVPIVFVSTNRFSTDPQYSNSITVELANSTVMELLDWTRKGLEQIYRPGYRYKKAGVMLNHLTPGDELSSRLFGNARFERSRRLMKAVDEINRKFGWDTVRFGAVRPGGRWETKCLRHSWRYTTCLNDVLKVKAC
jgi:DNA polymerase V